MANIEKARKEVKKAEKLLIGRFGNLSQVLAHLTRAVGHLIPDEPEVPQVHPEQPVSAESESETVTAVADTEDATPAPESGTEGPIGKPKARRTRKARR